MSRTPEPAATVAELLASRAAATPASAAFQQQAADGHWQPVTWLEFARRVQTLQRAMAAAGLRKGDRLALVAPVSLEWELLHHAALALGAVVVGLDAHDLPSRIADMAEQAAVAAFAVRDATVLGEVAAERLASARFVLRLDATGPLPPAGARTLTWADLQELGAAAAEAGFPLPPAPDDLATIVFTSGTTGAPRGIAYSHRQVCLAINAICEAYTFVDSTSRLLCWLPLSNLFQRIVNLAAVRQGAVTYLLGDPRRVMDVVSAVSPDIFIGVPRFYEKLHDGVVAGIHAQPPLRRRLALLAWALGRRMSSDRRQGRNPTLALRVAHAVAERMVLRRIRRLMGARLRVMITGSAPTPVPLLEAFHGLGWLVLEAYGLSENVVPIAMNRVDDYRFGTVGRPVAPNEIHIAADGVVRVRGPGLFDGYLGQAEPGLLDRDGFYATGDLGAFDADGFLRLSGRMGDLIKTSTGRRVAPSSVEAQLRQVAGIDQVVALGAGRKGVVALCTMVEPALDEAGRSRLVDALREQVARIGEHERPMGIALLDRPFGVSHGELTPNLKLRRAAIERGHAALIDALYRSIDARQARGDGDLAVL